jgi:hypothetical protein
VAIGHLRFHIEDFITALASAELTDMIMRENPARLYGF